MADTGETSTGTVESGWKIALQEAQNRSDGDDRDAVLTALCGQKSVEDCTFEKRRAAWAKNPSMAAKGMAALQDLLKGKSPCLASKHDGASGAVPALSFVACTLERQL